MNFKKAIFLLLLFSGFYAGAQTNEFCSTLQALLKDAATKFTQAKGGNIKANESGLVWESKIKIAGSLQSRIVSAMGLYYEAALLQSKSPQEIRDAYEKYKKLIATCLEKEGYSQTAAENFGKGAEQFKKTMYMKLPDGNELPESPPPHASMEVDYYKNTGNYTLIIYVWEH